MKIPEVQTLQNKIDAAHVARREGPRGHMGASQLGHACDRWLWLSFRMAIIEDFPGRILRVFRRGNLEEALVVADLIAAGCVVRATGGEQTRVDLGSHVSGSIDGIIVSGVPEAPKKSHVLEIKTHSKKSWEAVEKDGVEKSKPMHFIQMQIYMHGTGIDRALYLAVCKDDDRIYTERIRYDADVAKKAIERGWRLATSDEMPAPISSDPTWYQCRWCAAHDFCHVSHVAKAVNCRTCAHATATPESTWVCAAHEDTVLPLEWQREAHDCHAIHSDLISHPVSYNDDLSATVSIDGTSINNGPEGFSSAEILTNPKACIDPTLVAIRAKFGGRIVG